MKTRVATPADAAELLAIYAQYIDSAVTFEYELPSVDEFRRRIQATLESYPYLVALKDGKIAGYAYAHRLQPREAYQWSAELSIYLDESSAGHGLGTKLYTQLIDTLQAQGVRTVYGCVTTPNPASEKLHDKLGFIRIGTFRNAGFKNGAWHTITWFEKTIGLYDDAPAPPTAFSALPNFT